MAARPVSAASPGHRPHERRITCGSFRSTTAALVAVVISGAALPAGAETVKIAFIEGLSGPFAPVGQNILKEYQYVAACAFIQFANGFHHAFG